MRRAKSTAVLFLSLLAACGGGAAIGPAGVNPSKQVSTLSDAEKGSLCNWFVAMVGGYDAGATCADADLKAPPDQATCLATFPTCEVTVGQLGSCMQQLVAAGNVCTQQALTAAETSAACQAAGAAGCFGP